VLLLVLHQQLGGARKIVEHGEQAYRVQAVHPLGRVLQRTRVLEAVGPYVVEAREPQPPAIGLLQGRRVDRRQRIEAAFRVEREAAEDVLGSLVRGGRVVGSLRPEVEDVGVVRLDHVAQERRRRQLECPQHAIEQHRDLARGTSALSAAQRTIQRETAGPLVEVRASHR
jgi:hypothetical protein